MGTDIYRRLIEPDDSHNGIMREVWSGTPWVIDVFTDSFSTDPDRRRAMYEWCRDRFGPEAWPFGGPERSRLGRWREGQATVYGWTWFGFDTEAAMHEFQAAWPNPQPADTPSPVTATDTGRNT